MQEVTDLSYTTSEQHTDMTEARMKRDLSDLEKNGTKLAKCLPLSTDTSLRKIVNGVVAAECGRRDCARIRLRVSFTMCRMWITVFSSDLTSPYLTATLQCMIMMNRLKEFLLQDCSQLLFIHAATGCDMTSRIFGVEKMTASQKLLKGDSVLWSCANAFILPYQTTAVIDDLGGSDIKQ